MAAGPTWFLCGTRGNEQRQTDNQAQDCITNDDPDYRTLLALCEAGKCRLDEIKRFDTPSQDEAG
jgi:hypothetical protein